MVLFQLCVYVEQVGLRRVVRSFALVVGHYVRVAKNRNARDANRPDACRYFAVALRHAAATRQRSSCRTCYQAGHEFAPMPLDVVKRLRAD